MPDTYHTAGIRRDRHLNFYGNRDNLSLVYHPGWGIEHPLEAAGRALRLWPRAANTEADFASLPPVHPSDMAWVKGPTLDFLPGALGSINLPPLSSSFDPMELLPQFTSGGGW